VICGPMCSQLDNDAPVEGACVSQWPRELCQQELRLLLGTPKLDRSVGRG